MLNLFFLCTIFSHSILAVYQTGQSLLTLKKCPEEESKCTNLIPEIKVKDSQTCSNLCSYIDSLHSFNNNLRCKKAQWNEKTHHCHLQRRNRQRRNERKESPVFLVKKIKFYLPSYHHEPFDIVGITLSRSEYASTKLCKKLCHAIESCQAVNVVTSHQSGEFVCELLEDWNHFKHSHHCSSGQKCYFEHFHKVQTSPEVTTKVPMRPTHRDHIPDHFNFYNSYN